MMSIESVLVSVSLLTITVSVIPFIVIKINKRKSGKNISSGNENNQISGESNSITQIGTVNYFNESAEDSLKKKELTIDEIKSRIKVLFIDDKEFPVVEHLKSIGYEGVEYVNDVKDLDDKVVRFAHIIFIDINGVGLKMGFPNQGMGLCGALKTKYGNKKRIILYSGETEGSIFDKDAQKADATLKKDSDVYQFISYITDYAKELL